MNIGSARSWSFISRVF